MENNQTGYIPYIKPSEFELIYNEIPKKYLHVRLIFKIMYHMGLRVSEACRVKYSDIVGDFEYLRVTLSKTGRVPRIKLRVIPQKIKFDFEQYVFAMKKFRRNDYLFQPDHKRSTNPHLQPTTIGWQLSKIRMKLGLNVPYYIRKNGNPLYPHKVHACRNSFITNFMEKSGDLVLAQRVIGHVNLSTTARYIWKDTLKKEEEIVNMID